MKQLRNKGHKVVTRQAPPLSPHQQRRLTGGAVPSAGNAKGGKEPFGHAGPHAHLLYGRKS